MLLSVTILILLYFFVVQTFFKGKTALHAPYEDKIEPYPDFNRSSLFMSMIEEMFDIDLIQKQEEFRKQMQLEVTTF